MSLPATVTNLNPAASANPVPPPVNQETQGLLSRLGGPKATFAIGAGFEAYMAPKGEKSTALLTGGTGSIVGAGVGKMFKKIPGIGTHGASGAEFAAFDFTSKMLKKYIFGGEKSETTNPLW